VAFLNKSKDRGIDDHFQLKALVNLLPDTLYIKDRESRFIFVNQQLAETMGQRSPEKLIGKTDFDFFDRVYAEEFFHDEQVLMENDKAIINKRELIKIGENQGKWLLSTKIPVKNNKGHIVGLIGIGRDISLQKEAEDKLLEQSQNLQETNALLEEKQEEIKVQNEIIENEKKQLRILIDGLPDQVYFKDTDTKYITANAAMLDKLKLEAPENIAGFTDFDYYNKEKAEAYRKQDLKVLDTGQDMPWVEEIHTDEEGNKIVYNITKIALRDNENNIIGLVGITRDVTLLKQAEEKLLTQAENLREINTILEERQEEIKIQSEHIEKDRNQLRSLIDSIPDYIYIKDREAKFVTVNASHLKLMKLSTPDEVLGKTDYDFAPKELADQYYKDDMEVMQSGNNIYNKEEIGYDHDNNQRIISTTKVNVKDSAGNIIGLIGIGRDITHHKEIEKELRSQSEHLNELNSELEEKQEKIRIQNVNLEKERSQIRTLIDNLPDTIYFKDKNAKFIIVNERQIRVLKAKNLQDVIGKDDYDFYPKEMAQKYFTDDMNIIQTGEPLINHEEDGYDENGEARVYSTSKVPIRNKNGEVVGLIGIGRDITKQKEAENKIIEQSEYLKEVNQLLEERHEEIQQQSEELTSQAENLQEANYELERLNKTKDKFFSIIAHDLKNPFHAIMGFSELLTKEFTTMDDSQKIGLIDLINISSESAFNLLENLLQWARTQTDKIKFHPENSDLRELVDSNIKFHKVSALKKKITLTTQVPPGTMVYADSNMINTVIRNLISNAIKFTDNNGKITISAKPKEAFYEISISDTGIGIDKETLDKLFRIDEYHTSTGTSGESGTGLGLIICKEFVEKNNGKIWAESTPEKGSTFSFTIPASS